jgi:hypothetical protein
MVMPDVQALRHQAMVAVITAAALEQDARDRTDALNSGQERDAAISSRVLELRASNRDARALDAAAFASVLRG